MGLSDEERHEKAYYALTAIYQEFDLSKFTTWREYKKEARAIRASCEQLLGTLIQILDTNSAYWILGENEFGFRALMRGHFFRPENRAELKRRESIDRENEKHDMEIGLFAQHMSFSANVQELANWWDAWNQIPFLLYAVNRYEDRAFTSAFRKELNRLIANFIKPKKAIGTLPQHESILLWKYELFCKDREGKWNDKVKRLASMTQKTLEQEIEKINKERYESRNKIRQEEEKEKKIDPILGEQAPLEDLVKQIRDATKCSEDEALIALMGTHEDPEKAIEMIEAEAREEKEAEARKAKAKAKK